MRSSRLAIVALLSTLLGLLGSACYNPSFEGGTGFKCAKSGECPEGFVCSAQKVCVKPGAPQPDLRVDAPGRKDGAGDHSLPDASKDRGVDLPAPALTCVLEGGSAVVQPDSVIGQFGFALDEPASVLYLAYIRKDTSARFLAVKTLKLGATTWSPELITSQLKGNGALDPAAAAIAAHQNNWVAVFQDTISGTSKQLLAIDKTAVAVKLSTGNFAGGDPDVAIAPGVVGFFVAHQWKLNATDRATGELLFVDGANKVVSNYPIKGDAKFPVSGLANRLLYDGTANPPNIFYGGIVAEVKVGIPVSPTGVLIGASKLSPLAPAETLVVSSLIAPGAAGVDLAPGGHVVFSKQDGASTPQHVLYRAPGQTTGELMAPSGTPLDKVGLPRMAVRDGLVGVVALDTTFRLHFSVRDDKTASWSADLQMPTVATMARIVAVRGKAAGEVVFHIVYRADSGGPRLVHQPVTCTRK